MPSFAKLKRLGLKWSIFLEDTIFTSKLRKYRPSYLQ